MSTIIRTTTAKKDVNTTYSVNRIDGQSPKPSWTFEWSFPGSDNPGNPEPIGQFVGSNSTRSVTITWLIEGTYLLTCLVTTDEGCATNIYQNVVVSSGPSGLYTTITSVPSCTRQGQDYTYAADAEGSTSVSWNAAGAKFKTPNGDYVLGPYSTPVSGINSTVIVKWDSVQQSNRFISATGKNAAGQFATTHVIDVKPLPLIPNVTITGVSEAQIGASPSSTNITFTINNLQDFDSNFTIHLKLYIGEKTSLVGGLADSDFGGTYWPFNGPTYVSYPVSLTEIGTATEYTITHSLTIPGPYVAGTTPLRVRLKGYVSIESPDTQCICSGATDAKDVQFWYCPAEVPRGGIDNFSAPDCATSVPVGPVQLAKPTCPTSVPLGSVTLCQPYARFVNYSCYEVCYNPTTVGFMGSNCYTTCVASPVYFVGSNCYKVLYCPSVSATYTDYNCYTIIVLSGNSTL